MNQVHGGVHISGWVHAALQRLTEQLGVLAAPAKAFRHCLARARTEGTGCLVPECGEWEVCGRFSSQRSAALSSPTDAATLPMKPPGERPSLPHVR
jgi:hypothetical protein